MKKNRFVLLVLAAVAMAAAQAAEDPFPLKRVLTPAGIQTVGRLHVVIDQNNNGIEKAWIASGRANKIDNSEAITRGLIGVLAIAAIASIENSGPTGRAQKAAGDVEELIPAAALTASLVNHLQGAQPAASSAPGGVAIDTVSTVQKILDRKDIVDALEISSSYVLADDGSAFRAVFVARTQAASLLTRRRTPSRPSSRPSPNAVELSTATYSCIARRGCRIGDCRARIVHGSSRQSTKVTATTRAGFRRRAARTRRPCPRRSRRRTTMSSPRTSSP